MMMMLRIRSRDGLERVTADGAHITAYQLKALIEDQLQFPVCQVRLSLVPVFNVSCYYHCQGPLSSTFPIENRSTPATMRALKSHLERAKSLALVKRISDFHLLLFLAQFLDVSSDVPALAECVRLQSPVPEGYALLIVSMANTC